jgi:chromosomal replication initiation ATPase DnaA
MNAATLKKLLAQAETQEAAQTVEAVAKIVGIGTGTLTSRERTAEAAKKRAVVVWILADRLHWPAAKIATEINRTLRQVRKLLLSQRD